MPAPTPNQLWTLLEETGLVDADRAGALRAEFEIESLSPAAKPEAVTEAIAKWLVRRKVITLWQARRVARGDRGPFFIGDYRLLERLEKDSYQGGGAGHLFRARHEPSRRAVLMMLLDPERCRDLEVWTDIVRRTTVANRAADPVLSRTWALEQSGGQRFIVCEDVAGTAITPELAARGPRPVAEAGALVLAIARAVAELHRLGVVHGGVSLEALRREPATKGGDLATGRVRLLQFPLVADPHTVPLRPAIDSPEAIRRLATRASFLAPELLLPGAVCDARSDVYAIGCVMQALLTGTLPCWQGDAERTLAQVAFVGPEPLGPPQVPEEAAALVAYLTARDPAARYASAVEAADAIAACFGHAPVSPSLPAQQPFIGRSPAPSQAGGVEGPAAAANPAAGVYATPAGTPPVVAKPTVGRSRSRKRVPWLAYTLGAAAVAAVATGVIAISRLGPPAPGRKPTIAREAPGRDATGTPRAERAREPAPDAAMPEEAPAGAAASTMLVDAPDVPWASPTSGPPPTLAHLPPGAQLVLLARPAELLALDEGRRFVRALGPQAERSLAAAAALCGCEPDEIESLQAGWRADPDAGPATVVAGYAVQGLKALPVATDETLRTRAWGETKPRDVEGETLHVAESFAYWLPSDTSDRVLVAADENVLAEMITSHAAARGEDGGNDWRGRLEATLPPDLEELVGMLDATRHLTLFGSPNYLLHDGRPLLAGPLVKLIEPLGTLLRAESTAAALSLHVANTFYLEIDAVAAASRSARKEAADLAIRIKELSDSVEEYCNGLEAHPYGRKLVMRLPSMLRVLAANLRSGVEGKGIIVNCHLPERAGHNLALAAELALEQTPAAGGVVAGVPTPAATTSAVERLAKPISLTFARDTLEKSIQMLAEETGVQIEILGKDLELEGITKNQSFGLDERNQPAEAILRTILARSNPDGKLVYVLRKRDGVESIDVTTRAAAAKRGDQVPAVFTDSGQAGDKELTR